MIISHKYKYLFLETPRTGSTAIAKELRELYSGKRLLKKHSNYYDFRRIASDEEKKFLIFAGVRNPLDSILSKYLKYLTNHKSSFTTSRAFQENGGWVTKKDIVKFNFAQSRNHFPDFLYKFYKTPFVNHLNIHSHMCDHVIRFEKLNEGFQEALKMIEVACERDLPLVNTTKKDSASYTEYFEGLDQQYVNSIFGPYMKEWGYNDQIEQGENKVQMSQLLLYRLKIFILKIYASRKNLAI